MQVWLVLAAIVAVAVVVGAVVLRRRTGRARSPTPVPPRAKPIEAAPPVRLPPARIVLVAADVPVVELARVGGGRGPAVSQALDARALAERFTPIAREARELMALPGSTHCRALVRVEVARAMREGILPLLLARQPLALPAGEGVEIVPANAERLADLGLVAWQASGATGVMRLLGSLEGRIAALDGPALPGSSIRDTVAALRSRRGDLVALAGEILRGAPAGDDAVAARARLEQVGVSTAARTDALLRDLAASKVHGADAALALRRTGGALLVTVALRSAAIEVRALLDANADLALTSLLELESLLGRAVEAVSAQRAGDRSGIDEAVTEVLALSKEIEGALRAIRDRLFVREVTVLFEHSEDGGVGRLWLG